MFKKWFTEFKDFAIKGDMISLAIGIVIGTAFKGVIDSLVNDIIMPPISALTSKVNFSNLYISLNGSYESLDAARQANAVVLTYGNFINQLIIFFITAFAIFVFVYKLQTAMKGKTKDGEVKVTTKRCKFCDSEISIKATKCPNCTSNLK